MSVSLTDQPLIVPDITANNLFDHFDTQIQQQDDTIDQLVQHSIDGFNEEVIAFIICARGMSHPPRLKEEFVKRSNRAITNLHRINALTSLVELRLLGRLPATSLTLDQQPKLKTLSLTCPRLSDLTPLKNLPSLETLKLSGRVHNHKNPYPKTLKLWDQPVLKTLTISSSPQLETLDIANLPALSTLKVAL